MRSDDANTARTPEPPRWWQWQPVLSWPVSGCLLGVLVIRLMPDLPLGRWLFDLFQLHLTWPIALVVLTYVFWRIGARRQVRHGKPTFAPGQATVSILVMMLTVLFLLGVWGAEWPRGWWFLAGGFLAVAGLMLAVSWFAFTEGWRTVFNKRVTASVEHQIRRDPTKFIGEVERRRDGRAATVAALDWLAKKSETSPGRLAKMLRWAEGRGRRWVASYDHAWGSPHALAVLQGSFDDARYDLIRHAEQLDGQIDDDADRLLGTFLATGDCLTTYLTLNWPSGGLTPEAIATRRFHVFREQLVAVLWFASPPWQSEYAKQILHRVPEWLAWLKAVSLPNAERFHVVLEWIVLGTSVVGGLLNSETETDPVELERQLIQRILATFKDIGGEAPTDDADPRELLADVWLAVASRVDPLVRLDVGEAMAADLSDPPGVSGHLVPTLARASLAGLTATVEDRVPTAWRSGATGRARAAAEWVPSARGDAVRVLLQQGRRG